ncbi:hypothetical protein JTE90_008937 [Oedothorax gibbosus]|uniref:Uncharacterized protein n=1 Tax=Oedothorax gibbosus TaxID=931172 RepID=A0AAV6UN61_9ARAC|nr:hypothetical protein JTE90_008937 [Oedothorax gibbosus]
MSRFNFILNWNLSTGQETVQTLTFVRPGSHGRVKNKRDVYTLQGCTLRRVKDGDFHNYSSYRNLHQFPTDARLARDLVILLRWSVEMTAGWAIGAGTTLGAPENTTTYLSGQNAFTFHEGNVAGERSVNYGKFVFASLTIRDAQRLASLTLFLGHFGTKMFNL